MSTGPKRPCSRAVTGLDFQKADFHVLWGLVTGFLSAKDAQRIVCTCTGATSIVTSGHYSGVCRRGMAKPASSWPLRMPLQSWLDSGALGPLVDTSNTSFDCQFVVTCPDLSAIERALGDRYMHSFKVSVARGCTDLSALSAKCLSVFYVGHAAMGPVVLHVTSSQDADRGTPGYVWLVVHPGVKEFYYSGMHVNAVVVEDDVDLRVFAVGNRQRDAGGRFMPDADGLPGLEEIRLPRGLPLQYLGVTGCVDLERLCPADDSVGVVGIPSTVCTLVLSNLPKLGQLVRLGPGAVLKRITLHDLPLVTSVSGLPQSGRMDSVKIDLCPCLVYVVGPIRAEYVNLAGVDALASVFVSACDTLLCDFSVGSMLTFEGALPWKAVLSGFTGEMFRHVPDGQKSLSGEYTFTGCSGSVLDAFTRGDSPVTMLSLLGCNGSVRVPAGVRRLTVRHGSDDGQLRLKLATRCMKWFILLCGIGADFGMAWDDDGREVVVKNSRVELDSMKDLPTLLSSIPSCGSLHVIHTGRSPEHLETTIRLPVEWTSLRRVAIGGYVHCAGSGILPHPGVTSFSVSRFSVVNADQLPPDRRVGWIEAWAGLAGLTTFRFSCQTEGVVVFGAVRDPSLVDFVVNGCIRTTPSISEN